MLREDFPNQVLNPDKEFERMLARLQVVAVHDKVTIGKPDWFVNEQAAIKEVGGTCYYRELHDTRASLMWLRISQSQPTANDPTTGAFVLAGEDAISAA
jgi:hypothetical protein